MFYKVVREFDKDGQIYRRSARLFYSELYSVEYKLGEFVQPKAENTKLFVFTDYYAACAFVAKRGRRHHECGNDFVYTCEVEGVYPAAAVGRHGLIEEFWEAYHAAKLLGVSVYDLQTPIRLMIELNRANLENYVLVDRVKLLEKVA